MARRRRPSIGLIILFFLLLLLFFFSASLVEYVSNWAGWGSFTYTYVAGDEPIISITYTLPQDLADAMVLKEVAGWVVDLTGVTLSLTGGVLNPGESVTVEYRLAHYISGGTKTITVTARTSSGMSLTSEGVLEVPEVYLLNIAELIHEYRCWILIFAIIVLIILILQVVIGKKVVEERVSAKPETEMAATTTTAATTTAAALGAAGLAAAAGILAAAALARKGRKKNALKALEDARSSSEKEGDINKLDEAIRHVKDSLDSSLWVDDKHVDPKLGGEVFDEEKKAVTILMGLIRKGDTPQKAKDKCQEAINILVAVDSMLAQTIYEETKKSKADEVKKCNEELGKATEALNQGLYDEAIGHYKQAWEHAQRAIASKD